ncbi:unnamed protein product [Ostreobium quekettii]|uniref:Small nuclear ribonucleoprotein E n=1 Tax=Ostreobium quekettii TaxID=121088 RepID=A0A8S1J0C1_9CHLO|nr:unnamed protein product [Ostreobium quekettii]|eukprot:evm.model.scf_199.3 EVM.evm.TU.scf_199.3   scf_199:15835-16424(+)
MTQPINLIFRFLQSRQRISIWLFEQADMRIEGKIIGFDEYMNLVLDEAEEVSVKRKSRKALGVLALNPCCNKNGVLASKGRTPLLSFYMRLLPMQ